MKRIGIIILLALAAIGTYYYVNKSEPQTITTIDTSFAISNTESVDKIRLSDRENNEVILTKEGDQWMVNGVYPAFMPVVDLFLNETINKVRIKGPAAKASHDNIIRYMLVKSVHCEIYQDGKKTKDYYVGGSNTDETGTYVHLTGAKTPYIAYIPGFKGIITPKYSTDARDWYSKTIFDYDIEQIGSIEVTNYAEPNESFKLIQSDGTFIMQPPGPISQQAAKSYFALFKFKNFEGYAPYLKPETKDSIRRQPPFMEIAVTSKQGKTTKLALRRKGDFDGNQTLHDKKGDVIVGDVERYFATFTGMDSLVTVQDYVFGKIITSKSLFKP
ncbi:MAG: hypothetical protein RLZZ337_453 [Bacteroidota bacterium]